MRHHPATEGGGELTAEMELMKSRIIRFWVFCQVPYQIMWTVILAVSTGPMWYRRWTNSDEPSYFFEPEKVSSVALGLWSGHGRQPAARERRERNVTARSSSDRSPVNRRVHRSRMLVVGGVSNEV